MQHDADRAAARFVKTSRAALPHLKLFSNKYLNVRLTKLFLSCNIKISEHTFYLLLNAKG